MQKILLIFFLIFSIQLSAQENWKSKVFPDSLYAYYNWQFFTLMISEVHDTIDWHNPDLGLLNATIFYATNRARSERGLPTLTFSPSLRDMAFLQAQEMSKYNYVGHDNPWNAPFNTLQKRSRFFEAEAHSENVTNGFLVNYEAGRYFYRVPQPDGETYKYYYMDDTPLYKHTYWTFGLHIVQQFLDSPPHKKNMLFFHHQSLGCGAAIEPYQRKRQMPMGFGVQNFGK